MNDQIKSSGRAERREELRGLNKDYEAIAKTIVEQMQPRPENEFKQAIGVALLNLAASPSFNKLVGIRMIEGCIDAVDRGDGDSGRILLYLAGVIVDPNLTRFAFLTLMNAQEMFESGRSTLMPPPGSPPQG